MGLTEPVHSLRPPARTTELPPASLPSPPMAGCGPLTPGRLQEREGCACCTAHNPLCQFLFLIRRKQNQNYFKKPRACARGSPLPSRSAWWHPPRPFRIAAVAHDGTGVENKDRPSQEDCGGLSSLSSPFPFGPPPPVLQISQDIFRFSQNTLIFTRNCHQQISVWDANIFSLDGMFGEKTPRF